MPKDLGFNQASADTVKTSLNLSSLDDIIDRDYSDSACNSEDPRLVRGLYTKDELDARKTMKFKLP